jgi:hypothetical protein
MDTGLIQEAYGMMMKEHGDEIKEAQKKGQDVLVHHD